MKKFVVCSVSIGEWADFTPHCVGVFDTLEEAKKYKDDEMNKYRKNPEHGIRKVWNVEEIEF